MSCGPCSEVRPAFRLRHFDRPPDYQDREDREWNMDLSEVRMNIDRVDREIRALFIERMELADQVARIKAETEDTIYKPEREQSIIKKQTEGLDPSLVREYTALIKRIMEVSRKYQYGRTMELRQCFPFTCEEEEPRIQKPAMVKEELYSCQGFSRDAVLTVDNYEQVGELIREKQADAGMGIIEEIGVGVSDELHHLLVSEKLYVVDCRILEEGKSRKKVVTFTDRLFVLPRHNRVKILFECPNHSGSLGSILSMISDYGVNLTEIHSRPFRQDNHWNYMFFAELDANLGRKDHRTLLYQLSQETMYLQILGSYHCEDEF